MKCPKCNEEIADVAKFCTKCGVNIEEEKARIAEENERKQKEEEARKKEIEDRKKLEEIRKQEELKREEEIKEAEKKEAIRKAKEEGIELEIIDKKPEPEPEEKPVEFKKKEETPKKKKQKVKIKKNIFQVIINKLIFIIIVAALIIGGVYYCYTQNLLPEFAQNQVEEFDKTLQNVIKLNNEVNDKKKSTTTSSNENKIDLEESKNETNSVNENKTELEVSPKETSSADTNNIKELTDEVSIITKDGKQGLINKKTGETVLEPKYTQIFLANYYEVGKTEADKEKGIVVKDIEKFYKLDENYHISTEVIVLPDENE